MHIHVMQELDNQTYGVMLVACWLMTILVGPVSFALTKALKTRNILGGNRRSMQNKIGRAHV